MTKKNVSRKALFVSVIALMLCFAMLLGTTYAWFTDSVTSANNIIKSGTLKVEMKWADGKENPASATWTDASAYAIFNYDRWEPGYTEARHVKITNVGNLALKYQLNIIANGTVSELADVIDVYYTDPAAQVDERTDLVDNMKIGTLTQVLANMPANTNGVLLNNGDSAVVTIALKMQESAGNEYQNKAIGTDFSVQLVATQYTSEEDSFDKQYDKDATFPVTNVIDLQKALTEGKVAILNENITVSSTLTVPVGTNAAIDLNGKNLNYAVDNNGAASAIINNKGNLKIVGNGTISFTAADPDMNAIPAYATNTITNTGTLVIGKGVTVTNESNGGASYAVDVQSGSFTLDGGTLEGKVCALRIARFNADTTFVMNSGLVKGATPAWIHLPGSDANVAPKIDVTINGGTMQTTKATSAGNYVLYTYSFGNSHANTSVTINGGEFLGGTVSIGSGYKGDAPRLTINGGTFEYDVLQWNENSAPTVLYPANK